MDSAVRGTSATGSQCLAAGPWCGVTATTLTGTDERRQTATLPTCNVHTNCLLQRVL